ncbi:MAG: PASTA domain-containing protein, partial [Acidobacteriota bacterium]|nr:PASTA domain-containing protein [Acidobacteriota bacterium]
VPSGPATDDPSSGAPARTAAADAAAGAAGAVGGAVPEGAQGQAASGKTAEEGEDGASGTRRGRLWLAVGAIVVVAGLIGGVAYAVTSAKLFVPSHRVPSVVGDSTQVAAAAVRSDHFKVRVVGTASSITVPAGSVLSQVPVPTQLLKEGSTIKLTVSSGPPIVDVPSLSSVTGDCNQAASVLASAGFHANCSHANSTSVHAGSVISSSPQDRAPLGSTIQVTVSSGPPVETIPSLTGATCQGATTALQAVGLVAQCQNQYSATIPDGQVVSWSPTGQAPEGSTVVVQVSQGPPPVAVPDIYGDNLQTALTVLQNDGLQAGTISGAGSGRVVKTSPPPGTMVAPGSSIDIVMG